jgi:hypothetical protein
VQSFAQACSFSIATLQWHTPVPGLGPELCHAFPRPWDCKCVTVALGVSSVMVSGLACGSGTYESTPVADIAVNRHQSGISSLES